VAVVDLLVIMLHLEDLAEPVEEQVILVVLELV
jgi:hypothetical protein